MNNTINNTQLFCGNNIELLRNLPDNSVDAIVTDPPYGLGQEPNPTDVLQSWITNGYHEISGKGFMGKEWDAFVPQPLFWKEAYRVLKHGGHVLSFFGTRTYDWGVMAMRLAGFEVRDSIQWLYGSGFPKSHNISKAIDKMKGAEREIIGKSEYTVPKADNSMGENNYGISGGKLANGTTAERITADITALATEDAKQWDGWGSALKPANEPIVLARKPLEKGLSIAENVLKHSTGGLNIDGCRISTDEKSYFIVNSENSEFNGNTYGFKDYENMHKIGGGHNQGRFPANLILTHHPDCECIENKNGQETVEDWICVEDCPVRMLDEQSGMSKSPIETKIKNSKKPQTNNVYGQYSDENRIINGHGDTGGASRFFYTAKASKEDRNEGLKGFEVKQTTGGCGGIGNYLEDVNSASGKYGSEKAPHANIHPTVKPTELMRYLCRLITPPNGVVLDPFMGSGSTGKAAILEGFKFIGMELDEEYFKIAQARIAKAEKDYFDSKRQLNLF